MEKGKQSQNWSRFSHGTWWRSMRFTTSSWNESQRRCLIIVFQNYHYHDDQLHRFSYVYNLKCTKWYILKVNESNEKKEIVMTWRQSAMHLCWCLSPCWPSFANFNSVPQQQQQQQFTSHSFHVIDNILQWLFFKHHFSMGFYCRVQLGCKKLLTKNLNNFLCIFKFDLLPVCYILFFRTYQCKIVHLILLLLSFFSTK